MVTLPGRVRALTARYESPCPVCGALVLVGDRIVGPFGPRAAVWVHEGRCLAALYDGLGQSLPRVVARTTEGPTHRETNRADRARCLRCGGRFVLGRDGTPVPYGPGHVHETCPERRAALPCGHRAVYRTGPLAGSCRACARASRREVDA